MVYRFVNLWQTPEERRKKYFLLKSIGVNSSMARRQRDWRMSKIERLYEEELGLKDVFLSQVSG